MQFTYRFTSRYTPCILQNSHYNHVKVNIAPTKSPQFDSCTCLVGFTTIVFCFNLQNFSISQQSNQYVLIDPYMAPPTKIPKNHGFQYEVIRSHGQLLDDLGEISLHVLRQGTIPAHEEATFPWGGQGPDLDSPGIAW